MQSSMVSIEKSKTKNKHYFQSMFLNCHKNIHVLQMNIICDLSFVTITSRAPEKWPLILHSVLFGLQTEFKG